jgi:hypothetical protein
MPTRKRPSKETAHENRKPRDLTRLEREVAKLDPKAEQTLAEEGLSRDIAEWPEY